MSLIVSAGSNKTFEAAPEGLWQAVCVDVVDKGMQMTPWGEKPKCAIYWQLSDDAGLTEDRNRFLVVQQYGLSLHEKATLRKVLESWRGKQFSEQELQGFDLESVIGSNCQLQIVRVVKGEGREYANVQAVVPLGKSMQKIVPKDYERKALVAQEQPQEEEAPLDF